MIKEDLLPRLVLFFRFQFFIFRKIHSVHFTFEENLNHFQNFKTQNRRKYFFDFDENSSFSTISLNVYNRIFNNFQDFSVKMISIKNLLFYKIVEKNSLRSISKCSSSIFRESFL